MAKAFRFDYYRINRFENLSEVELTDLNEYMQLLNNAASKIVFYQPGEDAAAQTHFFFQKENTMYTLRNQPYRFIEDYEEAKAKGFTTAKDYYQAVELGYTNFKELEVARNAGVTDKQFFEKVKQGGFIEGLDSFNEKVPKQSSEVYFEYHKEFEKINNPVELCKFAADKGFSNYRDFERAVLNGYRSLAEYNEGKRLNFDSGTSYRKAIKMGFENFSEYNEAYLRNIQNKKEYNIYKKLKERARNNHMDEIVLFDFLAAQPNGRKIPVVKMEEYLDAEMEHYYFTDIQKEKQTLPEWFTRGLLTRDSIKAFVYSNPLLRQLGIYDKDGEYFEIFKIRESIVFVDASNVAHTAMGNDRPQMRRIWQVVTALKNNRFSKIVVIADASLKHKVSDSHNKKKLDTICDYIEAPAGTAADEFMIDKARNETGFIVTNDTFRDWKEKNKWVKEHIDQIRIPFMIQNEIVTFSLMEKFGENGAEL